MNALVGPARLGATPAMLLLLERALSALAISEAVTAGHREEGLMGQHAVVALGRNLGVDLVCATLDDPAALDLDNVDSRKRTSRATSARESTGLD